MFNNKKIKELEQELKTQKDQINDLNERVQAFYEDSEKNRVIARSNHTFLLLGKTTSWVNKKNSATILSKKEAEYLNKTLKMQTHIERI